MRRLAAVANGFEAVVYVVRNLATEEPPISQLSVENSHEGVVFLNAKHFDGEHVVWMDQRLCQGAHVKGRTLYFIYFRAIAKSMHTRLRFIGNGADPEHVFFPRVPFREFGRSFLR